MYAFTLFCNHKHRPFKHFAIDHQPLQTARHQKVKALVFSVLGVWIFAPQMLFSQTLKAPPSAQLPTGGAVIKGTANITQSQNASNSVMSIKQSTPNAIIDWSSFNVGQNALVDFVQPSASASILNRVNDSSPSQIFGQIKSNGQVFLSNPSGVYFSPSASVDVGALTATTHTITDEAFLAGQMRFERQGSSASVVNEGQLTAALGGYVALLAPEVRNSGVVVAKAGSVVMAAGERITLNFNAEQGLVGIITTPSTIASLISNGHAIKAPEGQIILSAQGLNQLNAGVINNSGSIEANSMSAVGGKIVLEADHLTLTQSSSISATGALGGGKVLIGSDWMGQGTTQAATTLSMEPGAFIDASATALGAGGTVVLRTDVQNPLGSTSVQGSVLAQGGPQGGNGGQVETSGFKLNLQHAQINTSAKNGATGQWLLDPSDVTIDDTSDNAFTNINSTLKPTSGVNSTTITTATLQNLLAHNNITITTTNDQTAGFGSGNITVGSALSLSSGNTLTLSAGNQIISNPLLPITLSNGSTLVFNAHANSIWSSAISGNGNVVINMPSSTLVITANNLYTGSTTITAGTLTLSGSGAISADSSLLNSGTLNLTNKSNISALDLQKYLNSGNVTVTAPSNLDVTINNTASVAATSYTGSGNITISDPIVYTNHLLNLSASNKIYINQPIAANYSMATNTIANALNTAQLQLSGSYVVNAPVYIGNAGANFFTKVNTTITPWVVITDLGTRADATTTPSTMTLQGLSGNFKVSNPSQTYFVLGSNIDAAPSNNWSGDVFTSITGFVPIGYYKTVANSFLTMPAAIRLDGLGHSVQNLSIVTAPNSTPSSLGQMGFIATLGNPGFIRNFNLTNETIQFNGANVASTKFNVGGLIGTSQYSTSLSNVSVSGSVSAALTYNIGGIAGSSASNISNAYSSALVTLQSVSTGSVDASAGGLAGRTIVNNGVTGSLSNDYASGNVIAPVGANAGSLIGDIATSSGTVSNSYASGQISSNAGATFSSPASIVGAAIGSGTLTQSAQLSAAASNLQANYVGWDFVNTWTMSSNGPASTYATPILLIEPSAPSVVYGATFPAASYSLVGLIGPDTVGSVTFTPSGINTSYNAGNSAGSYPFSGVGAITGQTNAYKLVFDSAMLTVSKANLYVKANANQSSPYGSTPSIAYGFNTAANWGGTNILATNSSMSELNGVPNYSNAPNSTSNVGSFSLSYLSGLSAKNYNFNAATTPVAFTVAQAPIQLNGIKTYDGNANFVTGTLSASGVNGETLSVISGSATANSKNVGGATNWSALNALTLGNGTGLASNYTLANVQTTSITINRLASVTWTGPSTGNWLDPSNWSGGAVPDLSNVANVVLPANKTITFGNTVVAPAEAGVVNITGLTGLGNLSQTAGTLNIGAGGLSLNQFAQTAGALNTTGNFSITSSFTQSTTGNLNVGGTTSITSNSGDVNLGNLNSTGLLTVASSAGAIKQMNNTSIVAAAGASFNARMGATPSAIDLSNSLNAFQGLTELNGSTVSLTNNQPLSLGNVTSTANLSLQSAGALQLGSTHVGADLAINSSDGNITQSNALTVQGNANLNAGVGNITLTQSGNSFQGTVIAVGTVVNIVGLPTPPPAPYTPPPDPALTDEQLRQMTLSQWANVSIQQWVQITPLQIPLLPTAIVSALSPYQLIFISSAQIKAFTNAQIAALTPLQIASFNPLQMTYLNDSQFAYLQPLSFAAFTNAMIQALSSNQIKQIPSLTFSQLSPNQLSLLSSAQLQALTHAQLASLSSNQVNAWTNQQLSALSDMQLSSLQANVLAHLAPSIWAQLRTSALQAIQADVFRFLSADQLNAMSATQLKALNALQISKISPLEFPFIQVNQLRALSADQLSMLNALQISRLTATQIQAMSYAQFAVVTTPLIKRYLPANFTSKDILNFFLANPSLSDAQVVSAMDQFGVSPQQISNALGVPLALVQSRYESQGGVVYQTINAAFSPLGSDSWGLGAQFTPSEIKSNALALQATGANYAEMTRLLYQFSVTPAQFRAAFVEPNYAQ